MLGLSVEKLLLVGLLAAVILGPRRFPAVVARVAALVRDLRRTVDAAQLRAASELGVPADAAQWRALDPRQYDPRRIIAEALAAPSVPPPGPSAQRVSAVAPSDSAPSTLAAADPIAEGETRDVGQARHPAPVSPEATPVARRVRVGTSAHPRWAILPAEAEAEAEAEREREGEDGEEIPMPPDPRTGPELPVLLY